MGVAAEYSVSETFYHLVDKLGPTPNKTTHHKSTR
jgi:hypothetical protein